MKINNFSEEIGLKAILCQSLNQCMYSSYTSSFFWENAEFGSYKPIVRKLPVAL